MARACRRSWTPAAWETRRDIADAVMAWGSFAYGGRLHGDTAHDAFAARLATVDAVVHNQDNREHDILDSDDYYQFQAGSRPQSTR